MDQSNAALSTKLTASIQDIQSYPRYTKPVLSQSLPASQDANLENLVKTGKLTQAQANQVKLCNPTSMFGTLLDMMQNPDGADSTAGSTTDPSSTDPFSILLDSFKAEDNTNNTNDDPMYDALAGLMPAYDQYGRPTAAGANSADINSPLYDTLSSLVEKAAPAAASAATSETSPAEKNSTMHASVADLLSKIKA